MKLREINEELQAQFFTSRVQEGQNPLQMGAGAPSLAQEIDNLPKDEVGIKIEKHELLLSFSSHNCKNISVVLKSSFCSLMKLMKALREQQEANRKLREYVDHLMLRILERNPALLEVERNQKRKWSGFSDVAHHECGSWESQRKMFRTEQKWVS